jgi:hypothetical protein
VKSGVCACPTSSFDKTIKFYYSLTHLAITPSAVKQAMKKGPMGGASHMLKGLKMSHLAPEAPSIANYTTGEVSHELLFITDFNCSSTRISLDDGFSLN